MQNKVKLSYTDHQSHSCRADKNPYRHDGRADKDTKVEILSGISDHEISISNISVKPKMS